LHSNKRYAKLIADEKAKAVRLGMLDAGATTPKKRAATNGGTGSAKKTKDEKVAGEEDNKDEDGEDVEGKDGTAI
jgi:hypothetical protein